MRERAEARQQLCINIPTYESNILGMLGSMLMVMKSAVQQCGSLMLLNAFCFVLITEVSDFLTLRKVRNTALSYKLSPTLILLLDASTDATQCS